MAEVFQDRSDNRRKRKRNFIYGTFVTIGTAALIIAPLCVLNRTSNYGSTSSSATGVPEINLPPVKHQSNSTVGNLITYLQQFQFLPNKQNNTGTFLVPLNAQKIPIIKFKLFLTTNQTFPKFWNFQNHQYLLNIISPNLFFDGVFNATLTIPSSVQTIASGAFWSTYFNAPLSIPNSVTNVASQAFRTACFNQKLNFQPDLTTIQPETFLGTIFQDSFVFTSNITELSTNAFKNTSFYSAEILPSTITNFANNAFLGACFFQNFTDDNANSLLAVGTFMNASFFGKLIFNIPANTIINTNTFFAAHFTDQFVLPLNVSQVNSFAFYGANFENGLTISSNPILQNNAFAYANVYGAVSFSQAVRSADSYAFYFTNWHNNDPFD